MFHLETGCLLLSALILGLVKGALMVHVCRLSFDALWEVSHPHQFYLAATGILAACVLVMNYGVTDQATRNILGQKISSILKGL